MPSKIHSAVFPGIQAGPLEHVIAAKAVCFKEAQTDAFKAYAQQVVANATALGSALCEDGFNLVTGGTDNHMLIADVRNLGITGDQLQHRLEANRITLNKIAIPNDPYPANVTSGVRIGTPAVTTRGFGIAEMKEVAKCISLTARDFQGTSKQVLEIVHSLCDRFPLYN